MHVSARNPLGRTRCWLKTLMYREHARSYKHVRTQQSKSDLQQNRNKWQKGRRSLQVTPLPKMFHVTCWNFYLSGVVWLLISWISVPARLKAKHDPQAAANMNSSSITCLKPRRLPAKIFHTWFFSLILNECGSDDSELIWLLELQKQRTKRMFNLSPGTFNLSQMPRVFFPGKLNVLTGSAVLHTPLQRGLAGTGLYNTLMHTSQS